MTNGIIAGIVLLVVGTIAAGAFAQGGPHGRRGPDFWQPGWMHRHMWAPRSMHPDMKARMRRHWTYMHVGIPKAYVGARSPYKQSEKVVAEGSDLYAKNCASCHGPSGRGNGEAGKALSPSPALLAFMIQRPMAVDEYLLWSIAEGGSGLDTAMPAFKEALTRDQIWKIVAFMRAGFPRPKK